MKRTKESISTFLKEHHQPVRATGKLCIYQFSVRHHHTIIITFSW